MNAHVPPLQPNRADLDQFLTVMFKHADEGSRIAIRGYTDNGTDETVFTSWAKIGDTRSSDWIFNRAKQAAEHEVAVCFCPPVATFSDQGRATEKDVANGVSLSVECDEHPQAAREKLTAILGLSPTLVVESGGRWVDPTTGEIEAKVHLHWRLSEPTRTSDDHARLKQARTYACKIVGGDPTSNPICHPMRWPGSIHRKREPVLARIIDFTDNEIELADALDRLTNACPEDERTEARSAKDHGQTDESKAGDSLDIAAALAAIPNIDLHWNRWNRIGMATWLASNGKAFAAFDAWSQKNPKYEAARTRERWDHYSDSPPEKVGAGTLYWEAKKACPGWQKPSDFAAGQTREERSRSEWPEPKQLPSGLLPVAAFDPEMIPASIAPWVADIADRMRCPGDFVAVSAMVALASTLGRKIAVKPQSRTDWSEVPNLWGCIVGRPGAMKSPAMAEAMKPLNRLEAKAREANVEALKRYNSAMMIYKIKIEVAQATAKAILKAGGDATGTMDLNEPERPLLKRYLTNDSTYEKLGEILASNPNGILVFRDELVSLLKTLDREEYVAARGFYLTGWNGKDAYTFDRIVRSMTHLDAVCLSLLGSTQPGRLAEYLGKAIKGGAGDDGLMQRFSLLVWPDDSGEWKEVDRYPDSAARQNAWDVFSRLDELNPVDVGAEQSDFDKLPFFRLDEGARDVFGSWRADLEKRLRSGGIHAAMESHIAKYRKLVPSLAVLNHLADGGTGRVSEIAMLRALSFAEYLETHARRAYGSGLEAEAATAKAILARMRKGDLKSEFTARDILQKDWSNLSDKEQVTAGLELLDDLHWIRSRKVEGAGRPKIVFTVSPKAAT